MKISSKFIGLLAFFVCFGIFSYISLPTKFPSTYDFVFGPFLFFQLSRELIGNVLVYSILPIILILLPTLIKNHITIILALVGIGVWIILGNVIMGIGL